MTAIAAAVGVRRATMHAAHETLHRNSPAFRQVAREVAWPPAAGGRSMRDTDIRDAVGAPLATLAGAPGCVLD